MLLVKQILKSGFYTKFYYIVVSGEKERKGIFKEHGAEI